MKTFICFICLLVGWLLYYSPIGKYGNIFSVLILFQIGFVAKKSGVQRNLSVRNSVIIMLVGAIIISIMHMFGDLSINMNRLVNPLYFIICSISGTAMCYAVGCLLGRTPLASGLSYMGKHTLPIVMFHFAAFKLVTVLQILIYKEPIEALETHGYLYSNGGWWICYTIVGIVVPLLIYLLYSKVKTLLKTEKSVIHE
ncbi:MAG: hypothetical protein LUC25_07135 [Ruminococcus sp.]|nr:hypothetical protein [Ruminococcus sp.]